MAVREYADWVLRPRLMAIPGVAQVIPIGGEVRQFQVQPDTARMAELGITHEQLAAALRGFSANSSGGFVELNGRELLIRHLARTTRLDDLKNLALGAKAGQPVLLRQVAEVGFEAALKRGDAGFEGRPAVILGIQKQPGADTIAVTRAIEAALSDLGPSLPAGMEAPRGTFRQRARRSLDPGPIGSRSGLLDRRAHTIGTFPFARLQLVIAATPARFDDAPRRHNAYPRNRRGQRKTIASFPADGVHGGIGVGPYDAVVSGCLQIDREFLRVAKTHRN